MVCQNTDHVIRVGVTNGIHRTDGRMLRESPKLRWIDDAENNFRNFGFRDRKHATSNLENWRRIAGESRVIFSRDPRSGYWALTDLRFFSSPMP